MSFDVFVRLFGDGISEIDLLSTFRGAAVPESSDVWNLHDSTIYLGRNERGNVEHFTVNRPSDSAELWEGLFDVLKRGDAVFYFPSDPLVLVVADPRALELVPPDMRETFTGTHLVHSADELIASLAG